MDNNNDKVFSAASLLGRIMNARPSFIKQLPGNSPNSLREIIHKDYSVRDSYEHLIDQYMRKNDGNVCLVTNRFDSNHFPTSVGDTVHFNSRSYIDCDTSQDIVRKDFSEILGIILRFRFLFDVYKVDDFNSNSYYFALRLLESNNARDMVDIYYGNSDRKVVMGVVQCANIKGYSKMGDMYSLRCSMRYRDSAVIRSVNSINKSREI